MSNIIFGSCKLSKRDNLILCNVNNCEKIKCPSEEDDIQIKEYPTEKYIALFPDTLWYEGFEDSTIIVHFIIILILK